MAGDTGSSTFASWEELDARLRGHDGNLPRDLFQLRLPQLVENALEPFALVRIEMREQASLVLERARRDLIVNLPALRRQAQHRAPLVVRRERAAHASGVREGRD